MKRLLISLIAAAAGIASLLAGLGIDAWLHANDPTLAEREGIFTLSNPGHVLLGAGVLLACGGVLCALHAAWGLARPHGWLGRPYVRSMFLAWAIVASASAVVFALGVSADGHDHHEHAEAASVQANAADAHVHTADESAPVDDGDPSRAAHDHGDGAAPAPAGHQHGAPVDATPDEIACGNKLVQDTQAATARFADFGVAEAEGYRPNPTKPDATHFGNPAYRSDGKTLDLAHPEALIYVTNRTTGAQTLIGALFVMPRGEAGPQPCGPVTYWHTHASCRNGSDVIKVEPGAACPAGYRYIESAQMMHVWFVPGRRNGVAPVFPS